MLAVVAGMGVLYALPNMYAPDPAVQIAGANSSIAMDGRVLGSALQPLQERDMEYFGEALADDRSSALVRFGSAEEQLAARELIQEALGDNFVVALNLAPSTPEWLSGLGGQPMKLGLDLSGGVHFLLEVDTAAAVRGRLEGLLSDLRGSLRDERIRHRNPRVDGTRILIGFRGDDDRDRSLRLLRLSRPDLEFASVGTAAEPGLSAQFADAELAEIESYAVQQNLVALRNRVNELGVAEPLVQRQGRNRIIVQLPGIQDTAEAKRILGRTANLEFRMEYDAQQPQPRERFTFYSEDVGQGTAFLERDVIVTGSDVTNASVGFDEYNQPQVNITLSAEGGKAMNRATRSNVGRRMGTLFIEHNTRVREDDDGQMVVESSVERSIISLATVQSALGRTFRITGIGNQAEASELALLLRAGSLAAPMIFVEERTIGPSLGADNVSAGMRSVAWGMILVLIFMLVWYRLFGLFANMALGLNLCLLVAAMSALGATLTLPGIAGIVLTLGMAVDANVLIFSRVREERRGGASLQHAIQSGYQRAFTTILDANLTTLIVALILYVVGSGPVQGFAVTLAIGIITSMFSAIFATRALVNLALGGRRRVNPALI